jgi:hypothetical protein
VHKYGKIADYYASVVVVAAAVDYADASAFDFVDAAVVVVECGFVENHPTMNRIAIYYCL